MNETRYRKELIGRIRTRFPGCVVMKNDPQQMQGIPDILILYMSTWAMLEIKVDRSAPKQPNQDHYVHELGKMSFVSFINPETEEVVLDALQQAFRTAGQTCVPQSQ